MSEAELRAAALQLPVEERLALATALLDSVEGPADPGWAQAWVDECDRRVAREDASGKEPISLEEFRSRMQARFQR